MSITQSLISYNFGGIRRKDSVFSSDKITCSDCQNVELFFTKLNSGVGIRKSNGNKSVTEYVDDQDVTQDAIPSGEEVIGMFETIQDGNRYFIVYTESVTQGKLYTFDLSSKVLTSLVTGLTVTGNACGANFTQGWLDMFIFSNGAEIKYIYTDAETHIGPTVETDDHLTLVDSEGRDVFGLGIIVFDSRLWVFNGKVLWYSQQGECRNFNYQDPSIITSSGYMEFVKDITAIAPYLGSLAVFHRDSSVLVMLDSTTGFRQEDESPGGCASYNALVFHGTDLYFYDDTKKGVFSFKQIVNGDKTLGDNIAYDIQEELLLIKQENLNKIRTLSVVTKDRNEIWFIAPISNENDYSYILIFDYIRGEWLKRKCQHINSLCVVDSVLYSAGESIYEEYVGEDFNGQFIQAYYTCTVLNLGSDNTLKITKFPPRATLDNEHMCHFWVKYVKNYNHLKSVKNKELKGKTLSSIAYYDKGFNYDNGWIYSTSTNVILKFPSSTFRALEITMYTTDAKETFALKALEFSKIKVKQI